MTSEWKGNWLEQRISCSKARVFIIAGISGMQITETNKNTSAYFPRKVTKMTYERRYFVKSTRKTNTKYVNEGLISTIPPFRAFLVEKMRLIK